jgi:hypothetical protein
MSREKEGDHRVDGTGWPPHKESKLTKEVTYDSYQRVF